jgi:hypothetical protein
MWYKANSPGFPWNNDEVYLIPPFDIFKSEDDGGLVWKGTAETLETAKLSVKVLMASSPGSYIIHSQKTGHQTRVNPDGSTERIT